MESHTLDHPDLSILPAERLARQLAESRAILEKKLGRPVRYLSYPAGRYNAAVVRAAQQAGYLGAVTTVYGETHALGGQFELTRIRVRGTDSLDGLRPEGPWSRPRADPRRLQRPAGRGQVAMPIYEYRCQSCRRRFSQFVRGFSQTAAPTVPTLPEHRRPPVDLSLRRGSRRGEPHGGPGRSLRHGRL